MQILFKEPPPPTPSAKQGNCCMLEQRYVESILGTDTPTDGASCVSAKGVGGSRATSSLLLPALTMCDKDSGNKQAPAGPGQAWGKPHPHCHISDFPPPPPTPRRQRTAPTLASAAARGGTSQLRASVSLWDNGGGRGHEASWMEGPDSRG